MKINIKIYLVILWVLPIAAFAQEQPFTINGAIGNLPDSAKAYLWTVKHGKQQIDSVNISDRKFTFKGIFSEPGARAYLAIEPSGKGMRFVTQENVTDLFLETGIVYVSSPDTLKNAQVTGGQLNADNQQMKLDLKPIGAKQTAFRKANKDVLPEKRKTKEY